MGKSIVSSASIESVINADVNKTSGSKRVNLGGLLAESRNAGGTFLCSACLDDCEPRASSPDPRYCQECYDSLVGEADAREGRREQRTWHPVRERLVPPSVVSLCIEVGDRIQTISTGTEVEAKWIQVAGIGCDSDGCVCDVIGASGFVYSVATIVEHQKGKEDTTMKAVKVMLTPQENLIGCRETLAKLEAKGADPRATGLWKSKVAQAERMCSESADAKVATQKAVSTTKAATKTTTKSAGTKSAGTTKTTTALPCQCGCGLIAHSGRNFLQGHDAKLASMIRKLDAGKLKLGELPDSVQQLIADDSELVKIARNHNK